MIRLRRPDTLPEPARIKDKMDGRRLPARWAIILLTSAVAAAIADRAGGSVPSLMVGVAVVTVLHQILD
jgi:hypothetical protein